MRLHFLNIIYYYMSNSKDNTCAPGRYDKQHNTCFSTKQLSEMAKAYNRYVSKQKLKPSKSNSLDGGYIIDNVNADTNQLLKNFRKIFGEIDEKNILQGQFMKEIVREMYDDINNETFRPDGPSGPTDWLSTVDINSIMNQYHHVYPDFYFLGAVPMDCDKVNYCSLFKMDFDEYYKDGYIKLGIIFNLDKHNEPGSHWVALYMDLKNGNIYYCDSTGNKPSGNILDIINKFKTYMKNNVNYQYNPNKYQKDGSECGVYSCNFLIRILSGESFDNIINNSLSFKQINGCRNKYFSNKPSKFPINELCDPN